MRLENYLVGLFSDDRKTIHSPVLRVIATAYGVYQPVTVLVFLLGIIMFPYT
jgi:hypothetical protein